MRSPSLIRAVALGLVFFCLAAQGQLGQPKQFEVILYEGAAPEASFPEQARKTLPPEKPRLSIIAKEGEHFHAEGNGAMFEGKILNVKEGKLELRIERSSFGSTGCDFISATVELNAAISPKACLFSSIIFNYYFRVKSVAGGSDQPSLTSNASNGALSDLRTRVAQQVERIRNFSGDSQLGFGELPEPLPPDDSAPVPQLINYGMDAIPELVPYLADKSFTQAYRRHSGGWTQRVRVNEYIIVVINRITQHSFYLPPELSDAAQTLGVKVDPALPKSIDELQDQINAWWRKNRTRALLDRKIDDISDPIHENRFLAYEWLGRTKAEAARLPLERRIETLLTGEVNSLKQSEMATCAESLGNIGNVQSADVVRKVCDHLSYWIYRSYRPIDEGRTQIGSMQLSDLFKAYHALSDLGFKDEALSRLQELESKYYGQMDQFTQQEFRRNLEYAKNW